MRKKIKDLFRYEINNIHRKHFTCSTCPLYIEGKSSYLSAFLCNDYHKKEYIEQYGEEIYEKEIEVE